jgi:epoxyqueuosine reductase
MDKTTSLVKQLAADVGFARVGIAPAGEVPHSERLRTWLDRGCHADMTYLSENLQKRLRPELLVPGARSVICLAVGYAPRDEAPGGIVARYARGRDYHKVLKRRCGALMDRIRRVEPGFSGRAFVDSGPVMERSLAAAAGLGWIGRNGCLVVPGLGSYVVLCEVICNLPLKADSALPCGCGDCRECVRACPAGAVLDYSLIDARRCISYLTIEPRGPIDREYWPRIGRRVFGCDACQEACPHNRALPPGDEELAPGRPPLNGAGLAEILNWDHDAWDSATRGSATRRADYETFLRNAIIAAGNGGDASLRATLERLAGRHPELQEPIRWAIGRLQERGNPV